jgi:prolycopene isomerase
MKLLQDVLLRDQYDVLVVGAGLGGLAAGSLLAKRGLSVLMIEQQDKPGGSCTSFKRQDVVFDVGTAMIYGFGEKGFKPFRFLMNELEEPIDIVAHSTLARMTIEGREVVFWPDVQRFVDELGEMFPEEKAGLRAFYSDLYGLYENIVVKNEVVVPPSEYSARQGLRSLLSNPFGMLKMRKLLSTSTRSLLEQYFHTPEVFEFYDKLCSAYCYCTAAETPAVLAATMFLDNHIGGVYYPAGGAQMLPNKIEKAFERYGGQVLYRHLVDEILIRDGKAYGVRLENGIEIHARCVVANATVWNIYGKLVRPEHSTPERRAWAQALVPTFPSMTLYMVVDREAVPPGAIPWEVFIEKGQGIDSSDLTLYINALVDQTLCPPDKLVITAIAPNLCRWPRPEDPAYRSEDYGALKKREADRMVDQIEQHYPGFREHIRTLIVGTPATVERYLLKNWGAVGGPKNAIGQEMLHRLHARSEWKSLYFCGDSTVMATGAPATLVSGIGAACVVLRDLHKKDYDRRRFPKQYVHFVDLPYRRPAYQGTDAISAQNAYLAAAQCQGCETPQCVPDCPAGADIPGFLRRMEAQNYAGAARLLREHNPFAEVCGYACAADPSCQRRCHRRTFAGEPVRIAELERWVCQAAGPAGWLRPDITRTGRAVAVVGAGVSGLTCAYYLALSGVAVELYDAGSRPGDRLAEALPAGVPQASWERDLQGVLLPGIRFHGNQRLEPGLLEDLRRSHAALCLDTGSLVGGQMGGADTQAASDLPGSDASAAIPAWAAQAVGLPGVYQCATSASGQSVVQAVAAGRSAAVAIGRYLDSPGREQPQR